MKAEGVTMSHPYPDLTERQLDVLQYLTEKKYPVSMQHIIEDLTTEARGGYATAVRILEAHGLVVLMAYKGALTKMVEITPNGRGALVNAMRTMRCGQ